MSEVTRILEDERPIHIVETEDVRFKVGQGGITAIRAYPENGHMAELPWLAIYEGDTIFARIPAQKAEIYYIQKAGQ